MNQLLPILDQNIEGDLVQTVNARELHEELGVKKKFPDWIKDQLIRGQLIENSDYLVIPQKGKNPKGGRPVVDYHISIDAAKSIAMMSGTEKGREVRQYFIRCEKQLKNQTPAELSRMDILKIAMDAEKEVQALTHQVEEKDKIIEEQAPTVAAFDRIAKAEGSACITDVSKQLQIRRNELIGWLSGSRWIYKKVGCKEWLGYQNKVQSGYLEHKVTVVNRGDGSEKVVTQVRITPKGLTRLSVVFNKEVA